MNQYVRKNAGKTAGVASLAACSTGYLTAGEAASRLGISRASLYAYTSRGQIRSEATPGKTRERRYAAEDIERLRSRQEARRDPAGAAARGLHWGTPVLDSGLTLVHNGRLYYRGRDAVELAQTATLEETAELLWDAGPDERLFERACALSRPRMARLRAIAREPLALLQLALPIAGAADAAAWDLRPAGVRQTGGRILRLLVEVARGRAGARVHEALSEVWAPGNAGAREAIRQALVLCADHELNVSAFTARCAASAAASPYDAVSAALATLK